MNQRRAQALLVACCGVAIALNALTILVFAVRY